MKLIRLSVVGRYRFFCGGRRADQRDRHTAVTGGFLNIEAPQNVVSNRMTYFSILMGAGRETGRQAGSVSHLAERWGGELRGINGDPAFCRCCLSPSLL
ncbi:hypothetical protein ACNY67_00390 [Pantoea sp. KXB45]|uniref:hypothetical protein n=1 Tax=Pantoea sp. KXB45 TaxID=3402309 RepID=UPI0025FB115C|nr:hypothetical protein [uncultured Pantoea sp.]